MAVTIGETREALDARIKKYRETLVILNDTYEAQHNAITAAMLVTGSMVYNAKEQYRLLHRMYSEAMGKRDSMALDSGELQVENSRRVTQCASVPRATDRVLAQPSLSDRAGLAR